MPSWILRFVGVVCGLVFTNKCGICLPICPMALWPLGSYFGGVYIVPKSGPGNI